MSLDNEMDQMVRGNELSSLRAQLAQSQGELEEAKSSFDLRWKSDMRAIKMWQAAHPGNELVWPSHDDLCVWLMAGLAAVHEERDALAAALEHTLDLAWDISQKGHHTNYDWNSDPLSLTLIESEMYAVRMKFAAILRARDDATLAQGRKDGLREAAKKAYVEFSKFDKGGWTVAAEYWINFSRWLDRMAEGGDDAK